MRHPTHSEELDCSARLTLANRVTLSTRGTYSSCCCDISRVTGSTLEQQFVVLLHNHTFSTSSLADAPRAAGRRDWRVVKGFHEATRARLSSRSTRLECCDLPVLVGVVVARLRVGVVRVHVVTCHRILKLKTYYRY